MTHKPFAGRADVNHHLPSQAFIVRYYSPQALLGLKCLDDDLSSSRLQQLSLSSSGVTHALQSCLRHCSSSGGRCGCRLLEAGFPR